MRRLKSFFPASFRLLHHLLERALGAGGSERLAALSGAVVRDFASAGFVLDDGDLIAGFGSAVEAQDFNRNRGTGFGDVLALVVDEGANAAPGCTGDHDITHMQRAALNERRANGAAAAFQLGFNDDAFGRAVGVGLEIENFGWRWIASNSLSRLVRFRAETGTSSVSPPMLSTTNFLTQKVGLDAGRVGLRLVDLVDRDDHRNAGSLGVIDGFHRLRHDTVIGCDHEHYDVRHLGAAGAHRGECGVAWRVDEGDLAARRQRDLIGTDVLGDAAGFAGDDVRLTNGVEQRGLAVVNVAHDGHDRGAILEVEIIVLGPDEAGFNIGFRLRAWRYGRIPGR